MRRRPCERAGVLAASRARRTLGARGGAVRLVSLAPETPEATVSARNMQRDVEPWHFMGPRGVPASRIAEVPPKCRSPTG